MHQNLLPIKSIRQARKRAADAIKTTPLDQSTTFSTLCGRTIYLKLENLQKTGSFKVRGALNRIQLMEPDVRTRGLVTASAGNHAQGVAYAAKMMGVGVTVVMPKTAALSKIQATTGYGAKIVLHGTSYREAYDHATALGEERGWTFVHAFDDYDVIAGAGTLGLELLEQLPDLDTVVVPVGGGGLLAGITAALRGSGSRARIVGVEASGTSSLIASMKAGKRVEGCAVSSIADGLATGAVGPIPFEIIRAGIDSAVEVVESEIADAILLLLERAKMVVEGAGAASLAACLANRLPKDASKVAVVISGGNIDTNLLDRIINLGLVAQGRLFRFITRLPDRPGQLDRLVHCIAQCNANIHQIMHDRAIPGLAPTVTLVTLEIETHGPEHIAEIERVLTEAHFDLVKQPS
jgi:threonine dehydratase